MLIDQIPAGFAAWTREEDGQWTIVKRELRTVEDLGRFHSSSSRTTTG